LAGENKTVGTYIQKPRTLAAVRAEILSGNTKATDLANTYYERIGQINPRLNVYLSLTRDRALVQASRVDDAAKKGDPLPPLAGIPIGIKDVLVMKGAPATAGSKILEGYHPPYDATAVAKLERELGLRAGAQPGGYGESTGRIKRRFGRCRRG
jgi:aspartyl-tRNA(Asn)/glutamyl-tRNA(Gln) amidotransferase subunit A